MGRRYLITNWLDVREKGNGQLATERPKRKATGQAITQEGEEILGRTREYLPESPGAAHGP